jgi:hypothetical protein
MTAATKIAQFLTMKFPPPRLKFENHIHPKWLTVPDILERRTLNETVFALRRSRWPSPETILSGAIERVQCEYREIEVVKSNGIDAMAVSTACLMTV